MLDSQAKAVVLNFDDTRIPYAPSSSPEMLVIDLGGPGHQYFIVSQKTLMCSLGGSAGPEERH